MEKQPLYVGVCTVLLLGCVAGRQYGPRETTAPFADAARGGMDDRGAFAVYTVLPPPIARFEHLANPTIAELKAVFIAEGVPPELVWLAELESGMDATARSRMGAVGLFQVMPATAGRFGLSLAETDGRMQPVLCARVAARYLKTLYGRFGAWPLAIAAYNAGEARVAALLQNRRARSYSDIAAGLPAETRSYVPRALALVSVCEGRPAAALPPPRT